MAVNKFIGIGYLGADAELRHTQNGQPVLSFRIAITEKWKDANGQRQERTEWVSCVLWGPRGEALVEYLTKGTRVYVEGGLRSSKYTDREGIERYKTEVNVNKLELLGGGARDDNRQQQGGQQQRGGYQGQRQQGGGYQQNGRQQQQGGGYRQGGQQGGGYGQGQRQQGGGHQQNRGGGYSGQQRQQQAPPPQSNWNADEVFGDDDIPF